MTAAERKRITQDFNSLSIDDRKAYLDYLKSQSTEEYNTFINAIRDQAVVDFWENERQLILKDGKCSRDWTPEQIEQILNFDENCNITFCRQK